VRQIHKFVSSDYASRTASIQSFVIPPTKRRPLQEIAKQFLDVCGHDWEILRALDFTRFQPVLLMFEYQYLSANDQAAAYSLLETQGYDFKETPEGDAIAWRKL
jgi:hypothetical protein